ncbi:MAG: ABC transporter permease, partial [Acidimicrobiales bacterium]
MSGSATNMQKGAPRRLHALRQNLGLVTHNPLALAGLVVIGVIVVLVLLGPLVWPDNPDHIDVVHRFADPSWSHPLGTDWLGRDELARMLVGGRASIFNALGLAALSGLIGTVVGSVAGYWGGGTDTAIMRVVDAVLSLPSLLVALAIVAVLGPGLESIFIGIVATWWTGPARLARAQVLA